MKKLFFGAFLLLAAATIYFYRSFALSPAGEAPYNSELVIDVPPGSTLHSVRKALVSKNLKINPTAFRLWAHLHGGENKLQVGEYKIDTSWSPLRIIHNILAGKVIQYQVTIPEGYNVYDINAEFKDYAFLGKGDKKDSFMQVIEDKALLEKMGVPLITQKDYRRTLEGFLFPETYTFQKYDSLKQVVHNMTALFESRALPLLKEHPWGKSAEGRYQLLVLASIVQKESWIPEEQLSVASVFWNRLNKKMRLQSDPTIIYGLMPNYDGKIHKAQILQPSAYNTYTIAGLPPGPICNPGESAIRAVVHPAHTEFFYFVGNGNGKHVFAVTYKEHAKNVAMYQLNRKQ